MKNTKRVLCLHPLNIQEKTPQKTTKMKTVLGFLFKKKRVFCVFFTFFVFPHERETQIKAKKHEKSAFFVFPHKRESKKNRKKRVFFAFYASQDTQNVSVNSKEWGNIRTTKKRHGNHRLFYASQDNRYTETISIWENRGFL